MVDVVGFLNARCKLRTRDDVILYSTVSNEASESYFLSHPYDERGTSGVNLGNVSNGFTLEFSAHGIRLSGWRSVDKKTCEETIRSIDSLAFGSAGFRCQFPGFA